MAGKTFSELNNATEAQDADLLAISQDKGGGALETRKMTAAIFFTWLRARFGTAATKDTGTGAGEVPTNADLGSAAYLDTGTGADEVRKNSENDSRFARLLGGADANFTIMPRQGGSPIVESGSNANGYWTKWADGSMVCKPLKRDSLTVNPTANVTAQINWTFPQSFIHEDACTVVTGGYSGAPQALMGPTTTWSRLEATISVQRSDSTSTWVNPLAYGFYK